MGIYEVDHIVAKQVKGGKAEYFIRWQNYSLSENTWEQAEHLPEDLIAAFENRSVDRLRADECQERIALLFEKGLKSPLACNETITMRHALSWFAVRPSWDSVPRGAEAAGLGPYVKKCLTVTGSGCRVDAPVNLKLFLGKSLAFLDEQGCKTAPRPVEKVQIKFTKSYFAGRGM